METVDYIEVLNGTCDRIGIDRDEVFTTDWRKLRTFHNTRLRRAWSQWWWRELMKTEKRFFRADWASGTAYAAAAEVYYPATDAYYTALRASTGEAPADSSGDTNLSYWADAQSVLSASSFSTATVHAQGDRVEYLGGFYQMHTASGVAGTLPTNTTYWGQLAVFVPYVALDQSWQTNEIGDVRAVWDRDPRADTDATELTYRLNAAGINVLSTVTHVWVEFRDPVPELTGEVFDATETYAVGDQVYYSSDSTPGNFYECLVATVAGQDPDDTAASWSVVNLPRAFADYLQLGAAADWEFKNRQFDAGRYFRGEASDELEQRQSTETSAQGQLPVTRVIRG